MSTESNTDENEGRTPIWLLVLYACALALAVILCFAWARYVSADESIAPRCVAQWANMQDSDMSEERKLEAFTECAARANRKLGYMALLVYGAAPCQYGVRVDACDLVQPSKIGQCTNFQGGGFVCYPRGSQPVGEIHDYVPCAELIACGKVKKWWQWKR